MVAPMDESKELFYAAQRRFAERERGRLAFVRRLVDKLVNLLVFAVTMAALGGGLGTLPRNPDNSIRFVYYGPVLAAVAIFSIALLRRRRFKHSRFRHIVLWWIIFAFIADAVGTIDTLWRRIQ